jgi:hypothetical protein
MKTIGNARWIVFAGSLLLTFGLAATDLAMTGCGNSGSGGNGSSVDPGDGSDFSGAYVLRDTDCDPFDGLMEFDVEQTGTDLMVTVTKAEGDQYFEGDTFDGTVIEGDGRFAAGVQELTCISQLVLNQQDIDVVKGISDVDVQTGDLDVFCSDESADNFCFAIYQRASSGS